jgi:GH18 family chitinase
VLVDGTKVLDERLIKKRLIVSKTAVNWQGSGNFNSISSSDANSITFCNSVLNTLVTYKLDGLDIDWEYPSSATQYTTLVKV